MMNGRKRTGWLVLVLLLAVLLIVLVIAPPGLLFGRPGRHPAAPSLPEKTGASAPIFRETAAATGIHFRHSNGAAGKFNVIEITGSGCAFFDYDNDGFLDILLVQSGPYPRPPGRDPSRWCRLYHNNRNGTFTDVTAGSGLDRDLGYCQGVAVGDYDNDGYDDLYLTAYGGNHLLHNEHGSGRFRDVTARAGVSDTAGGPQYATSAAFGDYDNDGRLDLYVCHYTSWTAAANRLCENAHGQRDYCIPTVYPPVTQRLYHNNGDGTFTDVTARSGIGSLRGRGLGAVWLDYDGDGREDLYAANDMSPAFLWHNEGGGRFKDQALAAGVAFDYTGNTLAGMGVAVGDYDNSGRESLFVGNFSSQPNTLYRNVGGVFQDASRAAGVALPHMKYLTFGCEFIDYDADGWKDLVVANGHVELSAALMGSSYREPKQLFHNNGGIFTEVTDRLGDLAAPRVARGLAVGDYDNDGGLDILVNNQNDDAQLFHNEAHTGNHWISLRTVGTKSNRDGYGAKVTINCAGRKYYSEVHGSSSFESHSDSRVYFGLGPSTKIDSLEVHWPSGLTDRVSSLAADHFYWITEGRGVTKIQDPQPGGEGGKTPLIVAKRAA